MCDGDVASFMKLNMLITYLCQIIKLLHFLCSRLEAYPQPSMFGHGPEIEMLQHVAPFVSRLHSHFSLESKNAKKDLKYVIESDRPFQG